MMVMATAEEKVALSERGCGCVHVLFLDLQHVCARAACGILI
jgi:hypothetical protein